MKLIVEVYQSYNKYRSIVHKLEPESEWLNTNRNFAIVEYHEDKPNYNMLHMAATALTNPQEPSLIETITYQICEQIWYDELNSLIEQYYAWQMTYILAELNKRVIKPILGKG